MADADAHLSYILEVIPRCNPRGLHSDGVSHILSVLDASESTKGEYLVRNINLLSYHHTIRQRFMMFCKSPQRGGESIPLGGFEVALSDALTRPVDATKGCKFKKQPT